MKWLTISQTSANTMGKQLLFFPSPNGEIMGILCINRDTPLDILIYCSRIIYNQQLTSWHSVCHAQRKTKTSWLSLDMFGGNCVPRKTMLSITLKLVWIHLSIFFYLFEDPSLLGQSGDDIFRVSQSFPAGPKWCYAGMRLPVPIAREWLEDLSQ